MFPTFLRYDWDATSSPAAIVSAQLKAENITDVSANSQPWSTTVSRIVDLLELEQEDDYGVLSPTQHSFKKALTMVAAAERQLSNPPIGSATTDSEGGIRVTWRIGDREVRFVCPATNARPVYIYVGGPDHSNVMNENVTSAALTERLCWLTNRGRSTERTST